MKYFLEAYEYFYKIFKDEKLAKDLAEKATGETSLLAAITSFAA